MTSVTIPRSIKGAENKLAELGEIATATEWHRAAIVAAFVQVGRGHGGRNEMADTSHLESARAFAQRGIAGLTHHDTVAFYANIWLEKFPRPEPGKKVTLPDDEWPKQAENQGSRVSPDPKRAFKQVLDKHGAQGVIDAVREDPEVAAAATQGLIETGNVGALSQATAKASQNRQVERNRKRASEGMSRGRSVQDPKPMPFQPDVNAFLSVQGLATALRALVTTFPTEWEALNEDAKTEEFLGVCEETCDKIQIALANCRNLVNGGVQDKTILRLLEGGVA